MTGSNGRTNGRCRLSLAAIGLVLVLLSVPTGLGTASPGSALLPGRTFDSSTPADGPGPHLVATAMEAVAAAGTPTPFAAQWTDNASGCAIVPIAFRWSTSPGSPVVGLFGNASAGTANFTAPTDATGSAEVAVRSVAAETCGNTTRTVDATATASTVEIAPLDLGPIAVAPAPLPVGGTANLSGTVVGGAAPYELAITWGDGGDALYRLAAPGPFRVAHVYARAGSYLPSVSLADSSGQEANATVPQALQVRDRAAFAIAVTTPVAEVGIPVRFTGVTVDPPPLDNLTVLEACNQTGTYPILAPFVSCDPTVPGTLDAWLDPFFAYQPPAPPPLLLREPVMPALRVLARPGGPAELGQPVAVWVSIVGGVAPFQLNWSFAGIPQPGQAAIGADGTLLLRTAPSAPGLANIAVTVTDADGAIQRVLNASVFVSPPLEVSGSAVSRAELPFAAVSIAATVDGGAPPYDWAVVSSAPFQGASAAGDPMPAPGAIAWSAAIGAEGWGSVGLVVADAAGTWTTMSLPVDFLPPLAAAFTVVAGSGSDGATLTVNVSTSAGVPPFAIWVNDSRNESGSGTTANDGPFLLVLPAGPAGNVSAPVAVTVAVVDRYGERAEGSTTVALPSAPRGAPGLPPAPAPSSSAAPLPPGAIGPGIAAAALLGIGVLAWRAWRQRRPRAGTTPPEPEKVLEGILAPSDGAERVTVELLAEEQGIPLETVRSTLERLIESGRVHAETTPEGEEVLAWARRPAA